ncbi:hypothetical protein F4819DRAFT_212944 [Hypoxylon fuscum]|nr:hypothetical protein F4819DRAFT_212944 [Hypoxylon fuscum]
MVGWWAVCSSPLLSPEFAAPIGAHQFTLSPSPDKPVRWTLGRPLSLVIAGTKPQRSISVSRGSHWESPIAFR